jgi:hypothetical protein
MNHSAVTVVDSLDFRLKFRKESYRGIGVDVYSVADRVGHKTPIRSDAMGDNLFWSAEYLVKMVLASNGKKAGRSQRAAQLVKGENLFEIGKREPNRLQRALKPG